MNLRRAAKISGTVLAASALFGAGYCTAMPHEVKLSEDRQAATVERFFNDKTFLAFKCPSSDTVRYVPRGVVSGFKADSLKAVVEGYALDPAFNPNSAKYKCLF